MTSLARLLSLAGLAALVVLSPVAAAPGKPFKVASTLDGKTVLPHRIKWLGRPTLPKSQVKEVDFLLDGKVRWIEHNPPYSYSDDGGYLVTSWLSPGRHQFTVRAATRDGRIATDTVFARVLPPPVPPASLAGAWIRTVDMTSVSTKNAPFPSGPYKLSFEGRWLKLGYPGAFDPIKSQKTGNGWGNYIDWTPGPANFHLAGTVTIETFQNTDQWGGWICQPAGPEASYTWSVTGSTLTLAPIGGKDACHIRGVILTGDWTRVG